jgi:hypothetical protein
MKKNYKPGKFNASGAILRYLIGGSTGSPGDAKSHEKLLHIANIADANCNGICVIS